MKKKQNIKKSKKLEAIKYLLDDMEKDLKPKQEIKQKQNIEEEKPKPKKSWLKTVYLILFGLGLSFWVFYPIYLTTILMQYNDKNITDLVNLLWWVIGANLFLILPLFIGFIVAWQPVSQSFKKFWHFLSGQKYICIKFLNSNMFIGKLYVKKINNQVYENKKGEPFFLNPHKSVKEDGYITFYRVFNNAFAHDFGHTPEDILDNMLNDSKKFVDLKGKKVKDLTEDIYTFQEPYKTDSSLVQQWAVQQSLASKTDIFDQLLTLLKKPNIIVMLGIIIILAAVAALGVGVLYYHLTNIQFCATASDSIFLKV